METNNTDNTKVFRVTAKSESKPLERETILSGTKIYSMGVKDILVDNPEYDFIFLPYSDYKSAMKRATLEERRHIVVSFFSKNASSEQFEEVVSAKRLDELYAGINRRDVDTIEIITRHLSELIDNANKNLQAIQDIENLKVLYDNVFSNYHFVDSWLYKFTSEDLLPNGNVNYLDGEIEPYETGKMIESQEGIIYVSESVISFIEENNSSKYTAKDKKKLARAKRFVYDGGNMSNVSRKKNDAAEKTYRKLEFDMSLQDDELLYGKLIEDVLRFEERRLKTVEHDLAGAELSQIEDAIYSVRSQTPDPTVESKDDIYYLIPLSSEKFDELSYSERTAIKFQIVDLEGKVYGFQEIHQLLHGEISEEGLYIANRISDVDSEIIIKMDGDVQIYKKMPDGSFKAFETVVLKKQKNVKVHTLQDTNK